MVHRYENLKIQAQHIPSLHPGTQMLMVFSNLTRQERMGSIWVSYMRVFVSHPRHFTKCRLTNAIHLGVRMTGY